MENHCGFPTGMKLQLLETEKINHSYCPPCSHNVSLLWTLLQFLFRGSWGSNKTTGFTVKQTVCTFILKGILDNLITYYLHIHLRTLPCTHSLTSTDLLISSPLGFDILLRNLSKC
ncbi:hypothetical protein GOODEAATRI_018688 [Goodea atripinnis]|uniref:Cytochrome c biogenesis B n=1 Tax=Goodea atripinnis TaxID=208336 RepID=A0ABV0NBN9_9TELE